MSEIPNLLPEPGDNENIRRTKDNIGNVLGRMRERTGKHLGSIGEDSRYVTSSNHSGSWTPSGFDTPIKSNNITVTTNHNRTDGTIRFRMVSDIPNPKYDSSPPHTQERLTRVHLAHGVVYPNGSIDVMKKPEDWNHMTDGYIDPRAIRFILSDHFGSPVRHPTTGRTITIGQHHGLEQPIIFEQRTIMKNLKEYFTGYPVSIDNAQSQEYRGVFGPMDAETVQGKDRFNLFTSEGLHRVNSFLRHFFRRATLNPQNEIANLRVRLNHMNLDFPFDNSIAIGPDQTFRVTTGSNVFGTTPTTDLSKGFDTGADLPTFDLNIRVMKSDEGYHIEANLKPHDDLTESVIMKSKRAARIAKMKKIKEDYELNRAREAVGGAGAKTRTLKTAIKRRENLQATTGEDPAEPKAHSSRLLFKKKK